MTTKCNQCQAMIDCAAEAIGTEPSLRSAACVEALAVWAGQLAEDCSRLQRELDDARKKNAELSVFVEAFCEVCEAHAGTSGESVSDLLDKALELEMWQL